MDNIKIAAFFLIAILPVSNVKAETWTANQLQAYLKNSCEISWQVEVAITDSSGNVTRDQNGNIRTKMETRSRTDYSCVPSKFSTLRINQVAEFQEIDENLFGNDYVLFDAGSVDLKCVASEQTVEYFKSVSKGSTFNVSGTVTGWEYQAWDDNFVMNCGL